jgi:signal transduction histidine kinase
MLNFILDHRREIVARACASIALRSSLVQSRPNEIPLFMNLFLSQLVVVLDNPLKGDTGIRRSAAIHGASMFALGHDVASVAHDYADISNAITGLIVDTGSEETVEGVFMLNYCVDEAIGAAITSFMAAHDRAQTVAESVRQGMFAHELRNKLSSTSLAFQSIVTGRSPIKGGVAACVTRGLFNLENLIDRSILDARIERESLHPKLVHLHQLMAEAQSDHALSAEARGLVLDVAPTAHEINVSVDPLILLGAVSNLLNNAFKFTPRGGHVLLRSHALDQHVYIDVADGCGGLPLGKSEELFRAFEQRGQDRSGLGLGLFIARKGIEASGGHLGVADLPGTGCVFTIDLPLVS